ncbi:MAG: alanine--tRNA ligase [Chitinophagales bacterium]|nr:alanine--tRNA ligase [Chitinophagales bacterium]
MTSREIRRQFLDFFASKEHKIIPSAPIVAKADPTLLFINSGMAPLKDFFLGNQTPPSKRVADTQKCLRVSGKHNDLEDVGFDGYHHTMFEMLGNWSFGDYFKKEAIQWSWELLTDYYKIPKDRLYVSVFKGDAAENLPFDQEAHDEWKKYVSEDRILAFGKKENFWEMGDQGPCGPCSEIHVDLRSDAERAKRDGRELVNADDPNVIEVWNNVFMQFNRKADRSLEELPAKSVDTGMGFERLCRAVQGVASNYDTDLWRPLFKFLSDYSGIAYTATYPGLDADWKKTDVAMRVVADHLRAVSFTIADGELPSNTGAGYVIRRILRRAVRYYYSFLDIKEPVLHRMAPILAEEFSDVFTELKAQIDFVSRVILEEEKSFLRTLESGLKRIENLEVQQNTVSGAQAFELFDTYGFPFDLTSLIAKEKGWMVDEEGFKAALQEQKERSRKDAAKEVGDWTVLNGDSDVEFVGYDVLEARSSYVLKYRTVTAKGQTQYQIVLNRTPFYPEGGGQVGDTGKMFFGTEEIKVLDTKKENTLVIHLLEKLPADLEAPVHCYVDVRKRRLTENNHSATHLLHAALRQVLGTHVQQKGSYLDEQTLRFDFAHFQKVSEDEIAEIERIVNEKIRENIALEEARALPIEDARKAGAMMLFGEKYGESVRMITFDPAYSRELCGGCHVSHTGKIGYFKLTSESAVAAGVRRIEAVTAAGAEAYVGALELEVNAIKSVLKSRDLAKGVEALQEENKRLQKETERLVQEQANGLRDSLRNTVKQVNGVNLIATVLPLNDANAIKTLAYELDRELGNAVIAFGSVSNEKPLLTIKISDNLVQEKGLNAGAMVRELAQKFLKGGGGGQAFFATAGGSDATQLADAVAAVEKFI